MWSEQDETDLRQAVRSLEHPTLAARIAEVIGKPLEMAMRALPARASGMIVKATRVALDGAMKAALWTVPGHARQRSSDRLHKALVAASGAAGGFFGVTTLAVELPVTTVIMLRSITDIARAEGEDVRLPECALACMAVFAFGSPKTTAEEDSDVGYYAVRSALAEMLSNAAAMLGAGGAANAQAPMLVRFLARVAERFGLVVSQKAAAQAVPVIGAVGGAVINTLFIDHFQNVARGHFTVRRLERAHGADEVQRRYEAIARR